MIRRATWGTRIPWEILPVMSFSPVLSILERTDVANVVLIGHSTSDGTVANSWFSELPKQLLQRVPPTLLSVSFFSCRGKSVLRRYVSEPALKALPSVHRSRWLLAPRPTQIFGSEDEDPAAYRGSKFVFALSDACRT